MFATLLGAWCLGGEKTWESKGKYIFSYFGMISEYIYDFEFFFFCCAWGLVVEKMWKSKGK